jgi:hypothetical protein
MNDSFAFGRKNYVFLLAGLAVVIAGYLLMSGGGSADPNEFSYEIFSHRRITVAPIVVLAGYAIVGYAIMLRPTPSGTDKTPAPQGKTGKSSKS